MPRIKTPKVHAPTAREVMDEAMQLPGPATVSGKNVPPVFRIVPKILRDAEAFTSPTGHVFVDNNDHPACNKIQIKLSKTTLGDDNKWGTQREVYVLGPLPMRTDDPARNPALLDGHTPEECNRALMLDPSNGKFYFLMPITQEEIDREAAMREELANDKKMSSIANDRMIHPSDLATHHMNTAPERAGAVRGGTKSMPASLPTVNMPL